jgi:hypothetical protein
MVGPRSPAVRAVGAGVVLFGVVPGVAEAVVEPISDQAVPGDTVLPGSFPPGATGLMVARVVLVPALQQVELAEPAARAVPDMAALAEPLREALLHRLLAPPDPQQAERTPAEAAVVVVVIATAARRARRARQEGPVPIPGAQVPVALAL